ncbi:MAG: hypothetical protein V4577_12395 [Bacteroidota bacterium]
MRPKLICLVVFLSLSYSGFGQDTAYYSKSAKYGNVKLSVVDVKEIVSVINSYHKQLTDNASSQNEKLSFELRLENSFGDTIVSKTFNQAQNITIKHRYGDLRLDYSSNYPDSTNVMIWASDYGRDLLVRSHQKDKTNTLFGKIDSIVKKRETQSVLDTWTHPFRYFLSFPVMIVTLIFKSLIGKLKKKRITVLTVTGILLCIGYFFFLSCLFFSSAFNTSFSRFQISPEPLSLVDISGDFIRLSAIVIIPAGLCYLIYGWIRQANFLSRSS